MSRTRKKNPEIEYNNRNPYAEDARMRKAGPMKSKKRQNKLDWQTDWNDEEFGKDEEFDNVMKILAEDSDFEDVEFSDEI